MKLNIAVLMGGDSPEHDISIITAVQAIKSLDRDRYNIFPVLVKRGALYMSDALAEIRTHRKDPDPAWLASFFGRELWVKKGGRLRRKAEIDCALLCTHGGIGENGSLQGFFEILDIPYTSCAVRQSAEGMSKLLSKRLFAGMKLKQTPYVSIRRDEFLQQRDKTVESVLKKLKLPVIVKPASLGSSIGIQTAESPEALEEALLTAAEFDDRILVEHALTNFQEVNCAAFSHKGEIVLSAIEKPLGWKDFLTFEDKYLSGGKMSGLTRELPAKIPSEQASKVQEITRRIYQGLDLAGVVRMDFLIGPSGKVYINEINTIPGSLAFYLFEEVGVSYPQLLNGLIDDAIYQMKTAKKKEGFFASDVLKRFEDSSLKSNKLRK